MNGVFKLIEKYKQVNDSSWIPWKELEAYLNTTEFDILDVNDFLVLCGWTIYAQMEIATDLIFVIFEFNK